MPYYPATRFTYIYDYILGLLVSGFNVEVLALKKQKDEIEHSYFKNKCKISYINEGSIKLTLSDILKGLPLLLILFFDIIRFIINPHHLINALNLFLTYRKKYDYIYATFNITSCIYGTYFKKISANTKIGFGIFDYYGGVFNLQMPEKHINYKPWINPQLIKFALSKVDFYTAFKEEIHGLINNLLKKLNMRNDFKFYIVNPTLSFCPVNKFHNSALNTQHSTLKILSIAGFEKFKGTFDFLNTAKEFIKSSSEFKVTFIGVDKTWKELQKFIEQYGLEDKINIITITDRAEIIKLISKSDLIIHTSYIETGPAVLIESLVCGKPIFIMNVGIARNAASMCKSVYIYNDFQELINKLTEIARNRAIVSNVKIPDLFINNTHFNATIQKLCWIFR